MTMQSVDSSALNEPVGARIRPLLAVAARKQILIGGWLRRRRRALVSGQERRKYFSIGEPRRFA